MHACIDLGSNSFHLLIGEWEKGKIRIIERLSEKVQLGENVKQTGKISPEAFERGLGCLRRFKALMQLYPLEQYWALGTNTFRVTSNAQEFIEAVRKKIGLHVSIISGVQEAVLIYAGVISSLPISKAHRLVIDVGGGSTEVIIGRGHKRLFTESLPIGSVAWRDRYFAKPTRKRSRLDGQVEKGFEASRELFSAVGPGIMKIKWQEAYASSGTMKMLTQICTEHGYGQGVIQLQALHDLRNKLVKVIAKDKLLPGLKEPRRDLLLPGWCVLAGLMESYAVDEISFSPTALREGMLDFLVKNEKTLKTLSESDLPDVSCAKP